MVKGTRKFSKTELKQQVRRLHKELGRVPTTKDFNKCPYCGSSITVKIQFDSWGDFLEKARVTHDSENRRVMIKRLKEVRKQLGYTPALKEFTTVTKYSRKRVIHLFKTMGNLVKCAGVEQPDTKKKALAQLKALQKKLRKVPSMNEFRKAPNTIRVETVIKLFGGSWNKFLIAAGFPAKAANRPKKDASENAKNEEITKKNLIKKYRKLFKKKKDRISMKEYDAAPGFGTAYIAKLYWDSWNDFANEAVPEEEIKEVLISYALDYFKKYELAPTSDEFLAEFGNNKHYLVGKHFDHWKDYLKAAGLSMEERKRTKIIQQYLDLTKELDRDPTEFEFEENGKTTSLYSVRKYFGRWKNLPKAAAEKMAANS